MHAVVGRTSTKRWKQIWRLGRTREVSSSNARSGRLWEYHWHKTRYDFHTRDVRYRSGQGTVVRERSPWSKTGKKQKYDEMKQNDESNLTVALGGLLDSAFSPSTNAAIPRSILHVDGLHESVARVHAGALYGIMRIRHTHRFREGRASTMMSTGAFVVFPGGSHWP